MIEEKNIEQKLVAACLRKDRRAQHQMYSKHKVFLYGVCLRYSKTQPEAEDILQEGFFKIFRDMHQWSGEGKIRAWMRKVMVNTALMHIRKYRKISFVNQEEILLNSLKLADLSLTQKHRADAVISMIQSLPDPYQTVFNLRAIEGYSFREIAEQLEINEATLRSHYLRARTKLQAVLQKELE